MKNKLITATAHDCDGIGSLNPCKPDTGKLEEVHGREVGLFKHGIGVQHFEDGATRAICEYKSAVGCRKLQLATSEACEKVIMDKLPGALATDSRFNIGNAKCKWEVAPPPPDSY